MKKIVLLSFVLLIALSVATATSAALSITSHTVKRGDTWSSLAKQYGISVDALVALNQPQVGTRIRIPMISQPAPTPNPSPTPTPTPTPTPKPSPAPVTDGTTWSAYLTAYTYWDNTPPGSADIALPVLHSRAGGTGTYGDPITLAVGHVITGGKSTPDFAKGTRFYVPKFQKYFMVEDLCGDGSRPQNGPCHTGYPKEAKAWLDMWVDGSDLSKREAEQCTYRVTGVTQVIQDPSAGLPVVGGTICGNN